MVAMETSLVLFGRMLNGGVEMIFGPAITNSRSSDNLPVADCAVL
jgi:hypothetical protein